MHSIKWIRAESLIMAAISSSDPSNRASFSRSSEPSVAMGYGQSSWKRCKNPQNVNNYQTKVHVMKANNILQSIYTYGLSQVRAIIGKQLHF